jgi:hypothetical protein
VFYTAGASSAMRTAETSSSFLTEDTGTVSNPKTMRLKTQKYSKHITVSTIKRTHTKYKINTIYKIEKISNYLIHIQPEPEH